MKLYETTLKYDGAYGLSNSANNPIRICVDEMSDFFEIPSDLRVMQKEKKKYILSIHDYEVPEGLKIRMKYGYKLHIFNGVSWINRQHLHYVTKRKLINIFESSKKRFLYVLLEEK